MPRNHKPRRRYIPKRIDHDPVGLAMIRTALLTDAERQPLVQRMQDAFAAFRGGAGSWDAWAALADAMNVAEALSRRQIASDHGGTFEAGQRTLHALHQRHAERRSWTLYPAEITALDDACFVHEVQLRHCSAGELADAVATVQRRVAAALQGNASPRAIVCGALGAAA